MTEKVLLVTGWARRTGAVTCRRSRCLGAR
jgi:hypothetical protein